MERSIRTCASSLAVAIALALAPREALAQDRASAEELFQLGKGAMAKKDYGQACDYFKGSLNASFALGTLLNLALCHEQAGRVASAWAAYRQLEDFARRASPPQKDRAEFARAHAEALRPRLSRIRIVVAPETKQASDLVVRIDDVIAQPELFEAGIPVDPGRHTVTASAASRAPSSQVIVVDDEKAKIDAPISLKPAETPPIAPVAAPSKPAPAPPPAPADSSQRTLGLVIGGIGAASLVTGAVFGIVALGAWDDATCAAPCTIGSSELARAQDAYSRANTFGWVSNVTLGVSALALGAGAYLFFTAGSGAKTARLGFSPNGVTLGGAL